MRPFQLPALVAALVISTASSAHAQTTLTFDDLDCGFGQILESYRGFSFENTDCFDGSLDAELGSGFFTAGGGSQVIYGAFGDPFSTIGSAPFNLEGFRVSAAWRNNLTFTVEGFRNGALVEQQTFLLAGPSTVQSIVLDWMNVDRVRFSTFGGDESALEFDGTQAVIDDVRIGAMSSAVVVPEPASASLLASGMLLLGAIVRRRQRTARR
jgi:hypothetical protein